MPELPEVEIARRHVLRWARGKKIVAVEAAPSRVLRGAPVARLRERCVGATFRDAERRGKNLVLLLTRGRERIGLRFHLGMTGKFARRAPREPAPRFMRATFVFPGVAIHFCDMRMFGEVEAGPWEPVREHAFADLGPDPLVDGVDARVLRARLAGTKLPIKVALMDQARIAGLGNIHAVEALWRAKISPLRKAGSLREPELRALASAIRASIAWGLRDEDADEMVYVEEPGSENPFRVYARGGESCPRCGHRIGRTVQSGRSTFWCKGCQR